MLRISISREARTVRRSPSSPLLQPGEPAPASVANSGARSPFLIVCDHAGRETPRSLGRLGLPAAAFDDHIAWDIGARRLAERLGASLGACVIAQRYSRLVIDCNRTPGHPQSILGVSDGRAIPANAALSPGAAQAREAAIFRPYHQAIAAELDARAALGLETVLVCVHSFTPVMQKFARPWQFGVLHLGDSPVSTALLGALRAEGGLVVGDNEPYAMDGTDYTAPFHGARAGVEAVEIETRQDLIADAAGQAWAGEILARLLPHARAAAAKS